MKAGNIHGGTSGIARLLLDYYKGGRRLFGYGRWRSARWAVQMVMKDLREARH